MKTNQIYLDDCIHFIPQLDNQSIDLCIVDPPYFKVSKDQYDYAFTSSEDWLQWMLTWSNLLFSKLKEGGSLYIFGGIGPRNGFSFWHFVEECAKTYTFCSYINWKRFRPKGYKGKHNNWGDCREDIAYFCKGNEPKTFNKQYMNEYGLSSASKKRFHETGQGLVCGNIWIDIPEVQLNGGLNRTLDHPDMKPIPLIERIIKASSHPGDLVLDHCMGSGTTCIASTNTSRLFIGCEKEEKYFLLAKKRLEETLYHVD